MLSAHAGITMAGETAPTTAGPVLSDTKTEKPSTSCGCQRRRIRASATTPTRKYNASAADSVIHATTSIRFARVIVRIVVRQLQVCDDAVFAVSTTVAGAATARSSADSPPKSARTTGLAPDALDRDAARYATAGTTIDNTMAATHACRTEVPLPSNARSASRAAPRGAAAHSVQ